MGSGDAIEILLRHDRWASGQMLSACEGLTQEQLHRTFEMGLGSVHGTIVHVIGAIQAWTDVLAGRAGRPWIDQSPRSIKVLRGEFESSWEDLWAVKGLGPLDEALTRERQGKTYRYTRAEILCHVATHGVHHRAQLLNMLRQLGVSPLPQSSVIEWVRSGGG